MQAFLGRITERPPRPKGQMEEQWKIPLSPLSPVARMTISMSAARSAAQARDRRSLTGIRRPYSPAPALGGCEWMRPPATCERDRGSHPRTRGQGESGQADRAARAQNLWQHPGGIVGLAIVTCRLVLYSLWRCLLPKPGTSQSGPRRCGRGKPNTAPRGAYWQHAEPQHPSTPSQEENRHG